MRISETNSAPDENGIQEELKTWDEAFTKVKVFNKQSSQAFVARHNKLIIIAFRGTDEAGDWTDNFNLGRTDISKGKVGEIDGWLDSQHIPPIPVSDLGKAHRGFHKALHDVWAEILSCVEEFRDNRQSVWLTGHSLGGALATLAAVEKVVVDQPFHGVYTFGQPRCCDRTLARSFNIEAKSRFFRFQNNNDIVSRIPQRVMGYSHVGNFIYISNEKELSVDIHWWFQFLDRVQGTWEDICKLGTDFIKDHDINLYVAALEQAIDKRLDGL